MAGEPSFFAILQLPECIRFERCAACFEEIRNEANEMPFFWKVRRDVSGKQESTLNLESLRMLFDKLGEAPEETPADATETDEESAAPCDPAGLRYFVALLLLQKRRLKMVDPTNAAEEAADLVVVDPKVEGMEPVALMAPEYDPDRLGNLGDELKAAIGQPATADTES